MSTFARTDTSILGRWWWTVDRWTLTAVASIVGIALVMALSATPAVAQHHNLGKFYFATRQFAFLTFGMAGMLAISLMSPRGVRRLALVGLGMSLVLMALTLFVGEPVKGATRWIYVGGFSLQASEFVKPTFAVVAAWLFADWRRNGNFAGWILSMALLMVVTGLLLLQPDVGMTIVVVALWAVEFFLAGLPLILVAALGLLFLGGGVGAYFTFDHVQARIDRFLDPAGDEGYQITKSLQAFHNGGLLGRGPGEGRVKEVLPDAHADFIFAVAGEEFGLILCLLIVALFAFVTLRGFGRAFRDSDLFVLIATVGLLVQFGLQAFINMASSIHLMPPKGMTLPFVSYGGSSTLAVAVTMGMVLALTRERPSWGDPE